MCERSFLMSSYGQGMKTVLKSIFCVLTGTAYTHHNMDKLSRIYPGGFRTDSSNYNPVPMWNVGCQIGTISLGLIQPLATKDVFRVFNSFAL